MSLQALDNRALLCDGDTVFALGVVALGWLVLGLKTGWSVASGPVADAPEFPREPAPAQRISEVGNRTWGPDPKARQSDTKAGAVAFLTGKGAGFSWALAH